MLSSVLNQIGGNRAISGRDCPRNYLNLLGFLRGNCRKIFQFAGNFLRRDLPHNFSSVKTYASGPFFKKKIVW